MEVGGRLWRGAISTSVHGSDFDLAPLPGIVQAIHLVGPGGKQYWVERREPITDRERLAALLPNIDKANIIYDDDWFKSVLVSMGCMGIIYSLVIEVRDQFGLEEVRAGSTWNTVRPLLADGSLFTTLPAWLKANRKDSSLPFSPRWLEIDVIAHPEENHDHVCFVRSRSEVSTEGLPPLPEAPAPDTGTLLGILASKDFSIFWDAVFNWGSDPVTLQLAKITNAAETHDNAALVHDITGELFKELLLAPSWLDVKGIGYQIMDTYDYSKPPPEQWRVLSLEMGIDASDNGYLDFIDGLFAMIDQGIKAKKFFAGGFFIRFAGACEAYLAMQQTSRTCHIEMDLLKFADSTNDLLGQFAAATIAAGGRLHWGLNSTKMWSTAYPNLPKWKAVLTALTNNGTMHTFENDFSVKFA